MESVAPWSHLKPYLLGGFFFLYLICLIGGFRLWSGQEFLFGTTLTENLKCPGNAYASVCETSKHFWKTGNFDNHFFYGGSYSRLPVWQNGVMTLDSISHYFDIGVLW